MTRQQLHASQPHPCHGRWNSHSGNDAQIDPSTRPWRVEPVSGIVGAMWSTAERDRQIASLLREMTPAEDLMSLAATERRIRAEYERLSSEARFDDYVPLLVRKRLRQELRGRGYRTG